MSDLPPSRRDFWTNAIVQAEKPAGGRFWLKQEYPPIQTVSGGSRMKIHELKRTHYEEVGDATIRHDARDHRQDMTYYAVGDLLTRSLTQGHAQKVLQPEKRKYVCLRTQYNARTTPTTSSRTPY